VRESDPYKCEYVILTHTSAVPLATRSFGVGELELQLGFSPGFEPATASDTEQIWQTKAFHLDRPHLVAHGVPLKLGDPVATLREIICNRLRAERPHRQIAREVGILLEPHDRALERAQPAVRQARWREPGCCLHQRCVGRAPSSTRTCGAAPPTPRVVPERALCPRGSTERAGRTKPVLAACSCRPHLP